MIVKEQKFGDDNGETILASTYVLCFDLLLQVIIDFRGVKLLSR